MKTSQFDPLTRNFCEYEIIGPSYAQRIVGEGYFIIVNPDSKYVSFCKARKDICFGDIASDIIHEYTNQQYVDDFGAKHLGGDLHEYTVREYLQKNCRMDVI